jgi:hypothetical protein
MRPSSSHLTTASSSFAAQLCRILQSAFRSCPNPRCDLRDSVPGRWQRARRAVASWHGLSQGSPRAKRLQQQSRPSSWGNVGTKELTRCPPEIGLSMSVCRIQGESDSDNSVIPQGLYDASPLHLSESQRLRVRSRPRQSRARAYGQGTRRKSGCRSRLRTQSRKVRTTEHLLIESAVAFSPENSTLLSLRDTATWNAAALRSPRWINSATLIAKSWLSDS